MADDARTATFEHPNGLPGPLHRMCSCPRKPPNHKGVRHHNCCWHDEPDVTICTCMASDCRCYGLPGDEPTCPVHNGRSST